MAETFAQNSRPYTYVPLRYVKKCQEYQRFPCFHIMKIAQFKHLLTFIRQFINRSKNFLTQFLILYLLMTSA